MTVVYAFKTLLKEQLHSISSSGIELMLVCSPSQELDELGAELGARTVGISIERKPSPISDLRSLCQLTRLFRSNRFDIVHSSTPKAGLLTALAGVLSRTPVRLHTFTGQPWVELKGLKRWVPKKCDYITAKLMTHCYADSASQREFIIRKGVAEQTKIDVIGEGSISGVNLERFSVERWGGTAAVETRRELGISETAPVIVFSGRVTRDKGIVELVAAFQNVSNKIPGVELVLVGPFEPERDPLPKSVIDTITATPRIHNVGFTSTPEKFVAAGDVFCLPSYREGFGSVVIEAAAMGLPTVASAIVGLVDAVDDGKTGILVPAKTVAPLSDALFRLLQDKSLRAQMGHAAMERAARCFDARRVNQLVVEEYWWAKK